MSFIQRISAMPQVFAGIMIGFLAILGVRVTYPFANAILGLWDTTNVMYVVAVLVMWLIYFFVLWIGVWMKFFEPRIQGGAN